MLLAFTMMGKDVAVIVLAIVAAGLAAGLMAALWWRKDTRQEERLKGYSEAGAWLKEIHFPHLSNLFICLGAKDISGAAKEMLYLLRLIRDPKQRVALLEEHFWHALSERLENEADRPRIFKIVQACQDGVKAAAGRALQAQKVQQPLLDLAESTESTT